MRNKAFRKLSFVNASGNQVLIFDETINNRWELGGRWGFTAPQVTPIKETYANGVTKVLKRVVEPRSCGVNVIAVGKTEEQLDDDFGEMLEILMDVSNGVIGKLYVTRSDGSEVYLNCMYISGADVAKDYRRFRNFKLEFYAADPYFYRDLDDVFINVPLSARLTLHDGLYLSNDLTKVHVLGENTGTGTGAILNNGSDLIQPIMRISRVKGDLSVTNKQTGDKIEFDDILIPRGDTLVIDTRDSDKNIYIEHEDGTISPAGQFLNWGNIEFDFSLTPGENIIEFVTGSRSTTDGMTFKMSERYLSA